MQHEKFGFGAAAKRVEDAYLLRGEGQYVSDLIPEKSLYAFVLRSAHAHADFKIKSLEAARALKGVKAILTYEDIKTYGGIPLKAAVKGSNGETIKAPPQELLCSSRVRYVGDAIAFIVATTPEIAKDASELIEIEFSPLPVVVEAVDALKPNAPSVWGNNLVGELTMGKADKTAAAFEKAHKIIEMEIINNRQIVNFMETRAAIGQFISGRYELTLSSQGSHNIQAILAENIFNLPKSKFRVVTPEVGGGFGTKLFIYREYPLVLIAAKLLKRPVTWVGERTEHFISCSHGRDHVSKMQVAVDKRAKILGAKIHTVANLGAYCAQYSTFIPWIGATMNTGVYDFPCIEVKVQMAFTNTVPVDAYRGAGRPEASYLNERMMDKIAREMGLSAIEVRLRNFIPPEKMPYKTALGRVYDSGEFAGHLTRALEVADYKGFQTRAKAAKKQNKIRGFGVSCYIEACGGGGPESAWINIEKDGSVKVLIGTQNNGQGHKTAYAQLVAQHLDIPLEKITIIQGDTDLVPTGSGTGGSRSLPVGGAALDGATQDLVVLMKQLASDKLEAAVEDLELYQGRVRVVGTDKAVDYALLANLPNAQLATTKSWTPPEATYPNGTHAVELEIDIDTGHTQILSHVIVDDFGRTINPNLLLGQVHGGAVQGVGQALMERVVYDANGQLLTASFMDYALPRAKDTPRFTFETRHVPCTTNALGVKGAGEAGTIGAIPAVMNAVNDALYREYGIKQIDMPATPQAIWAAINQAKGESL